MMFDFIIGGTVGNVETMNLMQMQIEGNDNEFDVIGLMIIGRNRAVYITKMIYDK